ncbi:6-phosphofructo-2-kinase 1 [Yarrowia sp. C11]|nr:6-phosphofructo-2-kinase 1 [Yarrowia sp. E02]KAG5371425.1 6-phosphofructo-2-kinase 1 [Yarrowia sp. C11]
MSDNATTPEDGSPVFPSFRQPTRPSSSSQTHNNSASSAPAPSIMRHPSFKHFQRRPPSDTPLLAEDKTPPQTPPQLDLSASVEDYLTIEKRPVVKLRESSILSMLQGASGTTVSDTSRAPTSSFTPTHTPQTSLLSASPAEMHIPPTKPVLQHSSSTLHIPDYTGHKRKPRATTLDVPGQTRSKVSPDGMISSRDVGSKLIVVMVGLPARGKSYITNKLCRYLNWQQHKTRIFNVGNTRREAKEAAVGSAGVEDPSEQHVETSHDASFFSPDNPQSTAQREIWAMETLQQCLDYVLHGNGSVGILDATNTTRERRKNVFEKIQHQSKGQLKVLFLESVCTDIDIINSNIRLKLSGPDYKDMDPQTALEDFTGRLRNYEKAYQTVEDSEEKDMQGFQYVKMIDVGRKVVCFNILGFLAGQVVFFLFNFNLLERQIWITRHGESQDNVLGRIGGDSELTPRGLKFSKALARFMDYQRGEFDRRQREKLNLEELQRRGSSVIYPQAESGDADPSAHLDEQVFRENISEIKKLVGEGMPTVYDKPETAEAKSAVIDDPGTGRLDEPFEPTPPPGEPPVVTLTSDSVNQSTVNLIDRKESTDSAKSSESNDSMATSIPSDSTSCSVDENCAACSTAVGCPTAAPNSSQANFCVWTSMLRRTVQTAAFFDEEHYDVKEMRMLNELGAGICDGMTYAEIKATYPHEYENRMKDKVQYRYPGPGGESYLDVISRLRPIICELERMHDHALIIGHRVVSRVLLAYFMNLGRSAIGDLDIPLHTLYCLEPKPYGVDWAMYEYNEEKDWFYKVSKEELKGKVPMVR